MKYQETIDSMKLLKFRDENFSNQNKKNVQYSSLK